MALIVENGTGRADAESYCSVAEADTYHVARGNEAAWFDLDVDIKEQLLRRATDYMLQMYRAKWKGSRAKLSQALDWPRYGVDVDDVAYSGHYGYVQSTVVPNEVRNACAELALRAKTVELAPDLQRQVVEKTVGPITTKWAAGAPEYVRYRAVDKMLEPFLTFSGGISLVRA